MDCSITQRCTPRPEPCSVPRAGDHGSDPGLADLPAVFVVVIAAVSAERIRALPWPAAAAADRRDGRDQGHELGDVVAVAAGQGRRQRDPVRFSDHVVLRARPGTVDRARARFGPPFPARTCELSITALDQSSAPAPFSSASSSSCSFCHRPASCQSRSRRQHVIPDPNPSSYGRNSHRIPLYSTNEMPHSRFRLSSHGLAVRCRSVPLFWTRRGIRAGGRVDGDAVEDSMQTPEVLLNSPCRSWSQSGSVSLARSLPIVAASSPRPCEK